MASSQQQEASTSSILPVQAILTLTVHGVPPVGGPMVSEFAHLRATIRTTLNGRLNPRGIHLTEVEVNDWTLHAHEVQHFEHRKEASKEQVGPQRADDVTDRPEEAIEMDEDGGEVNLLSQQLREVETGRRRRRRLSNTLGQQNSRPGPTTSQTGKGGGGILSTFLQYLYDAPVTAVARRLSLTSDPADATADLAVTVTVTGEQTPESLSINGKLRSEDFAYLVNRAALSSSEALANSLRSGGWLQVDYFRHAHAVSLIPRDDGGVIQYIPGDAADLDLLQMPSSDGRASASVSLAGRTSTADYSSSGAIPIGLASDASSQGTTDDKKATGIETSRGFLLDEDSPSYVPPSYLGEVVEYDSAYTNIGSATTVNPPGNGGRVSVGLAVFIALACVSTVLLSSFFTRRTVKRRKNDRATKARQAYDLPRKICSREWVDTLRGRINARRSRINATNDAATDAYVPPERRTQQQTMQPPTNRATSVLPSHSPSRSTVPATSTPGMRTTSGVMDTRAEYSSPAPVAARRGAQASNKTPSISSSATASRGSGKRVRFGADSVAGEELPTVLLSEVDF